MSDLATLQTRMAHAIMVRDVKPIATEFLFTRGRPEQRLNIYANNTFVSLKTSLRAVFPVTLQLADERFFDYAADVFIRQHPPREARLSRFGSKFPRFLATFEPCQNYPIVAQMATMEWAIAEMMDAPQLAAAPMSDIAAMAKSRDDPGLALQPNLRFIVSDWPLVQVWGEHRGGASAAITPTEPSLTRIAITRRDHDVHFMTLETARFAFWRALARGFPISEAAVRALAHDRLFDLVVEIELLFRLKLVTHAFTIQPKGTLQ